MVDLGGLGIFSTLSPSELKAIEGFVVPEHYGRKETIFSEGDPSEWFFIVAGGKVKITKLSYEGKEIILEIITSSNFFGGIAVIRGFPYPANAVAMEETDVLKIAKPDLMKIIEKHPDVMLNITQSIGDRIRESHETTKSIALEKVSSRIAALLLKLSEKAGVETPDGMLIDMKLTKQDIAEMVGTTVETSIRTMSEFKRQGLIGESGGKIVIKDPSGLESSGG